MASKSAGGSRYFRSTAPRRYSDIGTDVQRGLQAGEQIGKLLSGLGSAISGAQKQAAQNKVANQLLAQNYPDQPGTIDPQADLSTDLPESVSPDIGGTGTPDVQGNLQGGIEELKARQSSDEYALNTEYKRAQIANLLAQTEGTGRYARRATPAEQGVNLGTGSSSRWTQNTGDDTDGSYGSGYGKKSTKPPPYVPGSINAEEDDSADDPNKVAADFDAAQGGRKGTYSSFLANLPSLKPDANGNYTLKDKDGNPVSTVLASDVPYWTQRTNAARRAHGLTPVQMAGVPFGQPANPASTEKPGSSTNNPIVLESKLQARSLPYGTYVKDKKTGAVYTVDRPQ